MSRVNGFLNLNKPIGLTSHDCVAKVRRLLRLKRVGHAGTLDPAAMGVLPIAIGKATRLLQFLRHDKAYRATVRLGVCTTTDDLEGEILHTRSTLGLGLETVLSALKAFQGKIQQVPPNYSAIQVQGQRLYDLARQGKEIVVEPRTVEVFQIGVLAWRSGEQAELDLEIACGPGTYIRAIARDLGQMLQTGGTLAALLRTQSSGFLLAESLTLEALESQLVQSTFQPIAPEVAVAHLSPLFLNAETAHRWCCGQRIVWTESPLPETIRVHHESGQFLGISRAIKLDTGTLLRPEMVFEPAEGVKR
jgi:tRNA pseudouridine55 synthase